ncbi:MAG: hypothetical protein A3G33_01425 [Omnitrophica bacterium RIFCSPLOWO2_12_FULL_44_17]|uniref:Uncharacterized protein n=1 Tax=Candidatus Danuiimicrobium aquiferis TaxID=1801832 RepID=A0A1G1L1M6_9BACT|nr:MAG: hypothetical protein A3B72_00655 [Omnitrophica bacterium RIFCSPHIGHO2_02_FULL_45_28]OGW92101.1 MAG: hypothetical protein A3E74_01530 [Omnitrophica bacterium RIFCSPHIGHO2_12_FULL_44_12]OGW99063.1 MAG: hypothetical protein A3G33_01425 [Omnitrophica bacterium RIFCSPLOWO2_12_FULL_44_17]OGX04136.1 MAG: hypothetical protein A3J12_11075 [Omnitrophica bacterium RIFCSPLOWO2_02_FULL_44_11]
MTEQIHNSCVHDFEQLLQYVAENKIALTPKQSLIPLRHIKTVMQRFQIQESHEHCIGDRAYKTRDEMEYPRFYFLDLLAIGGRLLKITGKNLLAKGPNWETFFAAEQRERGFLIFHAFRYGFNIENWLLRGGDFGAQLEEKAEMIWPRILDWRDGNRVEWKSWSQGLIRDCGVHWNSIDQTHAEDLAIWGLEYCFVKPLEYMGLLEVEREGKAFSRLRSIQLNQIGCNLFARLLTKSGQFIAAISPYSLN